MQDVTDHEPEFTSLKREVHILCEGPSTESAYFDKAVPLCVDGCPIGHDLARPGQAEQDKIIDNYDRRLESLRKKLDGQLAKLNSQLKKGKEFESLTTGLSSWLGNMDEGINEFKIHDPSSIVIRSQLQKCQVCCCLCCCCLFLVVFFLIVLCIVCVYFICFVDASRTLLSREVLK